MERLTRVTPNGVKVGDVEYTSPKELVEALMRLAEYEDLNVTPAEFIECENDVLELNSRLRPFFDKYASDCAYKFEIPNIGMCCQAYSKSTRPDGLHWAHYPLCEGKNCPKLYPHLLEDAKLNSDNE